MLPEQQPHQSCLKACDHSSSDVTRFSLNHHLVIANKPVPLPLDRPQARSHIGAATLQSFWKQQGWPLTRGRMWYPSVLDVHRCTDHCSSVTESNAKEQMRTQMRRYKSPKGLSQASGSSWCGRCAVIRASLFKVQLLGGH